MALGSAVIGQRFENPRELLGDRLKGVYRLLADHGDRLFGDDYFADCYKNSRLGRPTVPARVLATVMVLQSLEGLSDQEAVDHLECDLRWQAAAGVDVGYLAFHSTVLVGQRNRLRASDRPKRFLEDTKVVAREAGVMRDRVRVLDSTPIYDAVSTQDTVTQLRSAIRKLLRVLDGSELAGRVRSVLVRDDDYVGPGKPACDWDDREAREVLVDGLVRDALAALAVLDGEVLIGPVREAAELLALVAGQDVEEGDDGRFRIARRVARDRIISTVDPDARHGHKSRNRRFDGYKAHLSVDPDSELIDDVVVTPANTHDADAVTDLVAGHADDEVKPIVMGDSAYAGADTLDDLGQAGFDVIAKVPPAGGRAGMFGKDDFTIDLDADTVGCPAGHVVNIRRSPDGAGRADFAEHCAECPLRERCTASAKGRSVTIHPKEAILQRAKTAQANPEWRHAYRSTRPKVERKIAHFVRVAWGGRKAREPEMFAKMVNTDLVGLFYMTRAVAPSMLRGGGGSIINLSSIFGNAGSENRTAGYFAAKGGVNQLTKLLACEWGDRGVRVNALAPNFFVSEMTRELLEDSGMADWMRSRTPMRRMGELPELVGPFLFLASAASSFVTGVVLSVDGGWSASGGYAQNPQPWDEWNGDMGVPIGPEGT